MAKDELSALTVAELKVRLKELGLKITGKKADLISRIEDEISNETSEEVILIDDDGDALLVEDVNLEPLDEPEFFEAELIEDSVEEIIEAEVLEAVIPEEKASPAKIARVSTTSNPWYKDGTNIATILVVMLIVAGGGWWYFSTQEVVFQASPSHYGDKFDFEVKNGQVEINGDEMVKYIRDQMPSDSLGYPCDLVTIDFAGTGTASITEGTIEDLTSPVDSKILGAIKMKDGYGREWNTVEEVLSYDLNADIRGHTQIEDFCSSNTPFTRLNNEIDISMTLWTEIFEKRSLRSNTVLDFRDSDGKHSATDTTTFGAISNSEKLTEMLDVVLLPMHPVDIYDMFQVQILSEGMTGQYNGWDWRVGGESTVNGDDAIMVYMEHLETKECLGNAAVTLWVVPDRPWPAKQSVEVMLDGDGNGQCGALNEAAIDYAFPEGTLRIQYTLEESNFIRGSDILDWNEPYSSMPQAGEGLGFQDEKLSWNTGTHMWDDPSNQSSSTRTFTLEKAVACVIAEPATFGDATSALSGDGYVFGAKDDRSGSVPVWNLSWVSSTGAGWVRVSWPGGDGCLNSGDGFLEGDDRPEHGRDKIPETLELHLLESRMTNPSFYSELNSQIMNGESLRSDTHLAYRLVIPEDNALTDLLPDDLMNGKVTTYIDRSWTINGEEHTLQAGMDAENGRMAGWVLTTRPSES